jgi:hypothetical protein
VRPIVCFRAPDIGCIEALAIGRFCAHNFKWRPPIVLIGEEEVVTFQGA